MLAAAETRLPYKVSRLIADLDSKGRSSTLSLVSF